MECLIVDPRDVDVASNQLLLRGEEAHHAAKGLRLRSGEEFLASDLSRTCYRAEFVESRTTGKHDIEVDARILEALPTYGEPAGEIELIIGFLSQPARW